MKIGGVGSEGIIEIHIALYNTHWIGVFEINQIGHNTKSNQSTQDARDKNKSNG